MNLVGRGMLCLVFVQAVISEVTGLGDVASAISSKALPLAPLLLVIAMLLMAAGSALVISGWRSRLGAVLLLIILIPTTLLFHGNAGDASERIQLLKNLSIMAGLLFVIDQDNA